MAENVDENERRRRLKRVEAIINPKWGVARQAYHVVRYACALKIEEYSLLWKIRSNEAHKDWLINNSGGVLNNLHKYKNKEDEQQAISDSILRGVPIDKMEKDAKVMEKRLIINKARRYGIQIPNQPISGENKDWELKEDGVNTRLRESSFEKIKYKVIQEDRERLRVLQSRFSLLFGLIGMIIALVTVLAN